MGWLSITAGRKGRNKVISKENVRRLEAKRGGGEEEGDKWKNKEIKIEESNEKGKKTEEKMRKISKEYVEKEQKYNEL